MVMVKVVTMTSKQALYQMKRGKVVRLVEPLSTKFKVKENVTKGIYEVYIAYPVHSKDWNNTDSSQIEFIQSYNDREFEIWKKKTEDL